MKHLTKTRTSTAKFEEFFKTVYQEKVFELFEKYPDKKSLIINHSALENFDHDLAGLLIDKPEEVIESAKIAIQNTEPLLKDADINIRFEKILHEKNLTDLTSRDIGSLISIAGRISQVDKPEPRIELGVFECRSCMRLHEVEQTSGYNIIEPSLCSECGGRSFRLLQEESLYVDSQVLEIKYLNKDDETSRRLSVVIEDDLVSHDDYCIGQPIQLSGIFKVFREKSGKFKEYIYCNHLEFLDYPIEETEEESSKEYGERNSPEYNQWKQQVLNRDKGICQCCGSEKYPRVHHIYGYESYPELRVDECNGIVLCKWCHGKYHSHYGIRDANPIDLMDFFGKFGKTTSVIFPNNTKDNQVMDTVEDISETFKNKNKTKQEKTENKIKSGYDSFMKIIKFLSDKDGLCSYKDLIVKFGCRDIPADKVLKMIDECKETGYIYEPIPGFVKITNIEDVC